MFRIRIYALYRREFLKEERRLIMLKNTVLEAKDIWKGYNADNGALRWVLQGVNLEIMEGDFIAILGGPGAGKSTLLKVLGFRETAERGAVYFEGRLVGRSGVNELEQMRAERVWLVNGAIKGNTIAIEPNQRLTAVLLDDPAGIVEADPEHTVVDQIHSLTRRGVAVIIATRDPAVAARADAVYKLTEGILEKITGISNT
jgi:ABC-type lipoprotein export system ATPase subunit